MFEPNQPVDEFMMWAACYMVAMHGLSSNIKYPELMDAAATKLADTAVARLKAKAAEFDKLKAMGKGKKGSGH